VENWVKRRRIIRGVLSMTYGKAVVAVLQLAMVPALATAWGLPQYGQWLLLATVPVFLATADLGFGSAAGNRIISEVACRDSGGARATFQSALAVVVSSAFVMMALVVLIAVLLPDKALSVDSGMDASEARETLIILGAYGLTAMQANLFMAAMRAHGGFAVAASVDATVQLAEGLAVIAVAVSGGSPAHAALAYLLTRTFGVLVHVTLARRRATWLVIGFDSLSRQRVRELLRPGLAAMVLPLAQAGYLQGTALAVGAAAGAGAVPIFTSLRTLSRVGLQLLLAVNQPVLPEFTAEFARGNFMWIRRLTGALTTFNGVVGGFAGLIFLFWGDMLLTWWTRGTIAAPHIMIALTAAALVAAAIWNPMSLLLLAVNRHEQFAYLFGFAAFLSVIVSFFMVRHWGVAGASVSSLLLDLAMLAFVSTQLRQITGPYPVGPTAIRQFLRKQN